MRDRDDRALVLGEVALEGETVVGFTAFGPAELTDGFSAGLLMVKGPLLRRAHPIHPEIAQQIAVGLYPSLQTTDATIAQTDEFLAQLGSDSPALHRLVLENRDGVARALRAQAADRQAG